MAGPDWGVEDFVRQLALMELLWVHVTGLGHELSPEGFASISQRYQADLRLLWEALEIDFADEAFSNRSVAEKEAATQRQLDLYLEAIVARTKTLQTVPPFLARALLEESDWAMDTAGMQAAIETAQRLLDLAGYEEVG
jgi:hypothetical protein